MDCPELAYTPFDLNFVQGNTPGLTVTVTLPDGVTKVDLTGAVIYLTAKEDPSEADPGLFQLSTVSGDIDISDQETNLGEYVVTFPAAATANLSALKEYFWDSKVELNGILQTVIGGKLTLTQAITQAGT